MKTPVLNCTRVTYNKAIGFSLLVLLILPSEVGPMVAYRIFGSLRVQHDVMHKLLIQGDKIGPIKYYTCVRTKHSLQQLAAVQFVTSDSSAQYFASTYSSSFEFFYRPFSSCDQVTLKMMSCT